MSEREIIESACKCGEPVHVEVGGYSCRNDGKRPYHPGAADLTTQFRCRKCKEWLGYSCEAAAFADATPPASHDAREAVLPRITSEDMDFLHYNPNTDDVVEWVQNYARLHAATLTGEVSRLTGERDEASARLHEVATLCATVEQERDRLTAELEKEKAQSRHLAGAVSRKIEDLIAVENQCGYYRMQYGRAEQVRKEACEANAKAQAAMLWLEADLERSRKECERLREAARSAATDILDGYYKTAGQTLYDTLSASGREDKNDGR